MIELSFDRCYYWNGSMIIIVIIVIIEKFLFQIEKSVLEVMRNIDVPTI